jgi:hypothetical protein
MAFFALVTGVGGGSVRDLLIWGAGVLDPRPNGRAGLLDGGLGRLVHAARWWEGRLIEWADAAGLGAYSVLGTVKALGYGVPPVAAALMGVITACVGGITRDVLAGQPSVLMRRELIRDRGGARGGAGGERDAAGAAGRAGLDDCGTCRLRPRGAAIHWELGIPSYGGGEKG